MKKLFESKTIWVAIIQGALGVILVLQTEYPLLGEIAVAKSMLDVALRLLTYTEIKL